MTLPTAQQINPHDCLDGRVAQDHFLGKTLEQAEALFREHPELYQDDLLWMGPVAFRYYVFAAIQFLHDDPPIDQADMIGGFAGTLEHRLEYEAHELIPIAGELASICNYIVEHYDTLGDLPKTQEETNQRTESLRAMFTELGKMIGDSFPSHPPEDYIDLRPRYITLQKAFLKLAGNNKS